MCVENCQQVSEIGFDRIQNLICNSFTFTQASFPSQISKFFEFARFFIAKILYKKNLICQDSEPNLRRAHFYPNPISVANQQILRICEVLHREVSGKIIRTELCLVRQDSEPNLRRAHFYPNPISVANQQILRICEVLHREVSDKIIRTELCSVLIILSE